METEIGPLGQPAHNNPKQQLSYFDSLNHIESRKLDEAIHQEKSREEKEAVENALNLTEEEKDKAQS